MIDVIEAADIRGYLHHQFIIWSLFLCSFILQFYHHHSPVYPIVMMVRQCATSILRSKHTYQQQITKPIVFEAFSISMPNKRNM